MKGTYLQVENPKDTKLCARVNKVLRSGMICSFALMILGLLLFAVRGGETSKGIIPLSQMLAQLVQFKPSAFVNLGILTLFATPISYLSIAMVFFWLETERLYALISVFTLCVLLFSILLAAYLL